MIFYESAVIQTDPVDHRLHLATAISRQRGVEHAERVTGYTAGFLGGGRAKACGKTSEFENFFTIAPTQNQDTTRHYKHSKQ